MGGWGRDAAHMARARAKRAPFTDPRKGRLKEQIRFRIRAFARRASDNGRAAKEMLRLASNL